MKKILLFILLILSIRSFSQNANTPTASPKNALAFDIAGIIGRFVAPAASPMPFHFGYRRFTSKGNAFRVGVGFGMMNTEEQEGDDLITNSENMFNVRLGYEDRMMLGSKWVFTAGADIILKTGSEVFASENDMGTYEDETKSNSAGGAIVFGIHYMPGERVTIGTEACAEFYSTTSEHTITSNFPDTISSQSKTTGTQLNAVVPMMLMIGIMF